MPWRTLPSASEPKTPTKPAMSSSLTDAPGRSAARSPVIDRSSAAPSAAVASTGIAIAIAATSTAEPTVARGLNRMILKAASYMSPRLSGRSGIAPGLWAAPGAAGARVVPAAARRAAAAVGPAAAHSTPAAVGAAPTWLPLIADEAAILSGRPGVLRCHV